MYEYRKDGNNHTYAVYFVNDDDSRTWGMLNSIFVYNPGETVQHNGLKFVVDYEI